MTLYESVRLHTVISSHLAEIEIVPYELKYDRPNRIVQGHLQTVKYIVGIVVWFLKKKNVILW